MAPTPANIPTPISISTPKAIAIPSRELIPQLEEEGAGPELSAKLINCLDWKGSCELLGVALFSLVFLRCVLFTVSISRRAPAERALNWPLKSKSRGPIMRIPNCGRG